METNTQRVIARTPPEIICHCRQIDRNTIERSIEQGMTSLSEISRATGAGSECGCCQVYIKELLGENSWLPVLLASAHRYSENYCAFRFARADGEPWQREPPGAYIIVHAFIDGAWVGRPYAITDDGADSGLREIIVKRKKGGFFSNWLFDHLDDSSSAPFRVSASVGGAVFDPNGSRPIICLIGGVGITPVLALCRMLVKHHGKTRIHIDYSANSGDDFFCRDELSRIARICDITVEFRPTSTRGRMRQADADALVQRYPGESYYICGSGSYKTATVSLLRKSGATARQITDLEAPQQTGENSEADRDAWGYRAVGLCLLAAYGLQDAIDLKWPLLEQWQSDQTYKICSGLLLLFYVLLQWRLPVARWLKRESDRLKAQKNRHKIFGTVAPLLFYLHATSIGYAYLAVLSSVYLANNLLGYGSGEFVTAAFRKAYVYGWTILHVGLSTSLLFLSAYHVYIALAYK
ncbi:(2Fe-2S)-binding protein [Methylotuvimicrobium alcaliphilum]|uniref:FAD-binding FR-type domain-containing protein n=1 Tax=Methylotuvimicrobium alcaliphilum (strain DSM 19304 / NCIMB 14124 / VKM B-2133 / 20Z) TaxID=1091494 RepID=G4SX38_META2|nr:(2Fe-2S)-binding protein [Methylotuvimicrobium alcaliphilum]CCE23093.1 protein of unknown function; putative ferredoxin reductase [Methylotuvimicrobium alcaliphilum 20Z]